MERKHQVKNLYRFLGLIGMAMLITATRIPASGQAKSNSEESPFVNGTKHLKQTGDNLIVEIDLKHDRPFAVVREPHGHFVGDLFRSHVSTRVAKQEANGDATIAMIPGFKILFIIHKAVETDTIKFHSKSSFQETDHEGDVYTDSAQQGTVVMYDESPRPKGDGITYTISEAGAATRSFVVVVKDAPKWDFTTEFGGFYVFRHDSKPAFGISKAMAQIGSSKLTLDAITVFGATADSDASIGGALTYGTLLGFSDNHSYRGIFGFPMKLSFTVGFEGLDLSRVNHSKGIFFGIGFSVPTSKR
jgi:hypothetical protein